MKKHQSNTWKLAIVAFTNDNSFGMGVFVVYMLWLGLDLAQVSIIISVWLIASSVGQIPSGIFADRYGYKLALVSGSVVVLVGALSFAFANGFYTLLVGFGLLGFGSAMKQGADHALLYETLKSEKQESQFKRLVGQIELSTNMFWVFASITGGFLYVYGHRLPFIAEAVVALVGLIISLVLIEKRKSIPYMPVMQGLKESVSEAFYRPRFSKIFLFSALIGSIALMTFQYIQPLFKELNVPEVYFGVLAASLFIFRGFGSWYSEKLGQIFSIDKYLVLHASVFGLFLLFVQYASSIFWAFPILAIFFFLRGLYAPTVSAYINHKVSSNKRATILSVNQQFLTIFTAVGVAGLGVVATRFGLQQVFFVVGVLSLLFLILYVLSLRTVNAD